ncbi:MAG: proton-translocating transhydrogenase family protein, partial [Myxococcota bacterium]
GGTVGLLGIGVAVVAMAMGEYAPAEFIQHFTVFVLSILIGWQVIWNVTPALHTPLMSVTNAISGIILVGGMLQAGSGRFDAAALLGGAAILLAAINVFGGFLVTQRMLQMFRK